MTFSHNYGGNKQSCYEEDEDLIFKKIDEKKDDTNVSDADEESV